MGRLNAMMSPISVLLPDPLEPTRAVVEPAAARNETWRRTSMPGLYSNVTFLELDVAAHHSGTGVRPADAESSLSIEMMSRIRSSPANASLTCVLIDAICMSGADRSRMSAPY